MASITIRNLDELTKARLPERAGRHHRSMADAARNILRAALSEEPSRSKDLAESIRSRFQPLGGMELPLATREPMRNPPP